MFVANGGCGAGRQGGWGNVDCDSILRVATDRGDKTERVGRHNVCQTQRCLRTERSGCRFFPRNFSEISRRYRKDIEKFLMRFMNKSIGVGIDFSQGRCGRLWFLTLTREVFNNPY